jgi:hypothetical protein
VQQSQKTEEKQTVVKKVEANNLTVKASKPSDNIRNTTKVTKTKQLEFNDNAGKAGVDQEKI